MSMYPDEQNLVVNGQTISYPGLIGGKYASGDITDPSKPASYIMAESINLLLDNISTFLEAAGLVPNNTSATQLLSAIAKYDGNYDLIVDSDAKLDYWINHTGGLLKRVLIRAGTWTASALGPTPGVLLNLDAAGTHTIIAESGSMLIYTGSFNGRMKGLYRATRLFSQTLEKVDSVSIKLTNTHVSGGTDCFTNIRSLNSCWSSSSYPGSALSYIGFSGCSDMRNCEFAADQNTIGQNTASIGFDSCDYLFGCKSFTKSDMAEKLYNNCTYMVDCFGSESNTAGASSTGSSNCSFLTNCSMVNCLAFGSYLSCNNLLNCNGQGVPGGTSGASGLYRGCIGVVGCVGDSGSLQTFKDCKKVLGCKAITTGTKYSTSYADSGTANLCADTASGGYNS